jgi:hypothetical protein
LQLLIFRQDAPLISPHTAQLAAEPYRASGLVPWREAVMGCRPTSASIGDGAFVVILRSYDPEPVPLQWELRVFRRGGNVRHDD